MAVRKYFSASALSLLSTAEVSFLIHVPTSLRIP